MIYIRREGENEYIVLDVMNIQNGHFITSRRIVCQIITIAITSLGVNLC